MEVPRDAPVPAQDRRPSPATARPLAVARRSTRLARKYVLPLLSCGSPTRVGNLLRTEWHLRRGDTVLRSLPPVVAFDPTNACMLECPLCPTGQRLQARPVGLMPLPFYREIVDQIAETAYKVVLHNWGEPLLHPQIADMVAYASRKGLATELSTNLNSLGDELPADLVRAGLRRLVVSLDGATQGSYERYRQGGTLKTVLGNITRMAEAKRRMHSRSPCVEVQILVMRHNEHELGEIEREARRAGADRYELGFTVVNTLDRRQMEEWLPTDNRYSRYDASTGRDRFNQPGARCSWLWRSLVVNWDGTVYPCCNFDRRAAEVGDLTKTDLRGLWNGPTYQELRRLFRLHDRQIAEASVSADRSICAWCRGVPRARSADEMGVY